MLNVQRAIEFLIEKNNSPWNLGIGEGEVALIAGIYGVTPDYVVQVIQERLFND